MGNFIEDQRKKHDAGLCEMMLTVQTNAQRTKLEQAREQGKLGWETANPAALEALLVKSHENEDWISVANYAGMLYCHSLPSTEGTVPRESRPGKGAGSPPRRTGGWAGHP